MEVAVSEAEAVVDSEDVEEAVTEEAESKISYKQTNFFAKKKYKLHEHDFLFLVMTKDHQKL